MDLKKTQKREMKVQEVPTSNDSREVLIAFSSETPVVRCINGKDYNEILLHTPDAVDLSRLKNGAALLFNHDLNQHIGIVEDANIDPDKVGRALVRFSTVGMGDEKYSQVKEGVLRKVSVGYEINDYQIDGDNLIVTNWAPYEISMVSVPADDFVGVGRSIDGEQPELDYTSTEEVQETVTNEVPEEQSEVETSDEDDKSIVEEVKEFTEEVNEEVKEIISDVVETVEEVIEEVKSEVSELINKDEEQRIAELNGMARVLKLDVSDAIANGISVEDFKRQLKQPIKDDINIMENKFSLSNSIRAMSNLDAEVEGLDMGSRGVKVPATSIRVVNTLRVQT